MPAPLAEELQIGKILVKNELISEEQLRECAELQKKVREVGGTILLGEVLIQKGYLDEPTLRGALAVQREKMSHALALHPLRQRGLTPEADTSIGKIAIENGLIVKEQLDEALEIQKKVRALGVEKRIGEILVDRRQISREALEGLLSVQQRKQKRATEVELQAVGLLPSSGTESKVLDGVPDEFLVRTLRDDRIVSESLVAEAQGVQKKIGAMGVSRGLGGILLAKGYLTIDQGKTIAAKYATQGARKGADERPEGHRFAMRDVVLVAILGALALYVVFKDGKEEKQTTGPGKGPAGAPVAVGPGVPPSPGGGPSGVGGGGGALAGVPPEEIDQRCADLVRDGAHAAFGAMVEVGAVTRAAADGRAYGPAESFREADFTAWFTAWEGRTLGISRREPALRARLAGKPLGAALGRLDEVVRTVHAYGLALRSEVADRMRFSAPPGPSDTPSSLRDRAIALLDALAEAGGFELPEEESEGE